MSASRDLWKPFFIVGCAAVVGAAIVGWIDRSNATWVLAGLCFVCAALNFGAATRLLVKRASPWSLHADAAGYWLFGVAATLLGVDFLVPGPPQSSLRLGVALVATGFFVAAFARSRRGTPPSPV